MQYFDMQVFLDSLGGDAELADELMGVYGEDAPDRLASLENAILANQMDQVTRFAHSLKGMSGVLRAQALVDMALDIELAARDGQEDTVRDLFPQFKDSVLKTLDVLHKHTS